MDPTGGRTGRFQGLPSRICWLGYGERNRAGERFNEMVASGELKGPIVIGRDHLDAGSVASPERETEAMRDGSDAVADWPILNALVNTACGASWVSVHQGGGVGMGKSIHAGQVVVADGSELAAERVHRVLTADPGMGVIRHADAGYEAASSSPASTASACRCSTTRRRDLDDLRGGRRPGAASAADRPLLSPSRISVRAADRGGRGDDRGPAHRRARRRPARPR